jgi:hypothetical protein
VGRGAVRTKELQKFFHSSAGLCRHVQDRHPETNRLNAAIRGSNIKFYGRGQVNFRNHGDVGYKTTGTARNRAIG